MEMEVEESLEVDLISPATDDMKGWDVFATLCSKRKNRRWNCKTPRTKCRIHGHVRRRQVQGGITLISMGGC